MKISYRKGYASNYFYNQVIRLESKSENENIFSFIKDSPYSKEFKSHFEIWLKKTKELREYFKNDRIKYLNTIIFKYI